MTANTCRHNRKDDDDDEESARSHPALLDLANAGILRLCDRSVDSRPAMVLPRRPRLHCDSVRIDALPASDLSQSLGKVAAGVEDRIDRVLLLDSRGVSVVTH